MMRCSDTVSIWGQGHAWEPSLCLHFSWPYKPFLPWARASDWSSAWKHTQNLSWSALTRLMSQLTQRGTQCCRSHPSEQRGEAGVILLWDPQLCKEKPSLLISHHPGLPPSRSPVSPVSTWPVPHPFLGSPSPGKGGEGWRNLAALPSYVHAMSDLIWPSQ